MDYKQPVKEIDVTEIFGYMGIGDSAFLKIPSAVYDSNGSAKKYYTFWLNLVDFKQKDAYILEKAEQLIELKNYGLSILNSKNHIYGTYDQFKNLHFDKPWFVPVILDKMKMYEKNFLNQQTMTQQEITNKEKYICDNCDISGIEIKSQKEEFIRFKEIIDL
jgi:hypothetical protein